MIGTQPTGAIAGVSISAPSDERLSVTVDSKPAHLAVVNEAGEVIAMGQKLRPSRSTTTTATSCKAWDTSV